MSSPSSRPPAGVPASGGNVKYAAVAALLVLAIGALFTWRSVASKSPPAPAPTVPPPVASAEPADPKLEEIPPPPPVEEKAEAGPGGPRVVYVQAGGCDAKCVGTAPPELRIRHFGGFVLHRGFGEAGLGGSCTRFCGGCTT